MEAITDKAPSLWQGTQRRRCERTPFYHKAWAVDVQAPEQRHGIVTQDISPLGVGFIAIRPFVQNSWIVLTVSLGAETRKLLSIVRRCDDVGNGFYFAGAEFVACKTDDPHEPAVPAEWLAYIQRGELPPGVPGQAVLDPQLIPIEPQPEVI